MVAYQGNHGMARLFFFQMVSGVITDGYCRAGLAASPVTLLPWISESQDGFILTMLKVEDRTALKHQVASVLETTNIKNRWGRTDLPQVKRATTIV